MVTRRAPARGQHDGNEMNQAGSSRSNDLEVSVIIPTRNRAAELERAVASILLQTIVPRQLIIVDQSDGDESRRCVEQRYRVLPQSMQAALKLEYVHDVRIQGANAARNRGMDLAAGQIWVI